MEETKNKDITLKSDKQSEVRFEQQVIKKIADIPKKYKCCRCKKDMRKKPDKGGCECNTTHPFTPNKSGGQIMRVIIEYRGRDRFGNYD